MLNGWDELTPLATKVYVSPGTNRKVAGSKLLLNV
jgi:hypothetical protein